tara:strand:+ start:2182 stop:3063 length:882 start_codon:yes stop_codon:yes gene_type:complete
MISFKKKLEKIADDTDLYLKKLLSKNNNLSLMPSIKYSMFSGGKRFRSAIIVNTGKIFDISYKSLIAVSAAVECIHSYSLIHDDLPSMDNDDFRRGRLSTHKKYNEFTAILAGNSLLTLAFQILSNKDLKLSPKIKNDLISTLSVYSGFSGLAGGQFFDLTYENKKISKKKIIDIQKNKTGKLFSFCCESSGIIKKQSLNKRKKLRDLGLDIGLLFQIADDLLDFKGDSKKLGKPTKNDKKKGKPTLVNLIGHNKTLNLAKNLKNKINKKIKNYGIKSNDLLKSVEFILNRDF